MIHLMDHSLLTLFLDASILSIGCFKEELVGLNHARTTYMLLVAMLVVASPMHATDSLEPTPSNWAAPPYWAPPAGGSGESASPDSNARSSVGRQSLAAGPTALPFISVYP